MTYKEATEYINQIKKGGINPGLAAIDELCRRLDYPQDKLKFIHIAGTNGKGSVLSFISTILKVAGYRTGRFFSPALSDYHERFQINNRLISKADFCRYLEIVKAAADSMVADGLSHPTSFEIDTAFSFLYFAEKGCDIVVLETGMGGTLDATNIVKNTLVAVLTPIGMDHADYLGRSYVEIAAHKAGIIKAGVQVVCGGQRDEVYDVIAGKCKECGSVLQLSPLEQIGRARHGKPDFKNLRFEQLFTYGKLTDLEISMAGEHQIANAILALDTIKLLKEQGFSFSEKNIRKGLKEAVWPGRFQMIAGKPPFLIDGAHNADAALTLAEALKIYFTNKRIIYIMGILRDKDYQQIIINTSGLAEHIITVTPPDPRALSSYELALEVAKVHPQTTSADSIVEACGLASLLAGKDGIIVAFGSLTFLEMIKKYIKGLK
ncbi:MAG: bifunctional folylpolyglutamate synthase/dihydrofolate synthase [Lachnospiraceae bacterium]|nr:bifunctional folylpolyglutamate synthase/dihydrofolate synthase [Lachnospiraceae bacterium]